MIAFEFDRDAAAMDALVDGELSDEERRALLARLEAVPDGWRKCALAFLEAQAWRQTFGEATREVVSRPAKPVHRQVIRVGPWLARAAAVLIAFGLGWAVRIPRGDGARPTLAQATDSAPRSTPPPVKLSPTIAQKPAPPDYLRGRLEREGFQVERTRIFVPTATKDGRPVSVPVQQTRVRFVGNRAV